MYPTFPYFLIPFLDSLSPFLPYFFHVIFSQKGPLSSYLAFFGLYCGDAEITFQKETMNRIWVRVRRLGFRKRNGNLLGLGIQRDFGQVQREIEGYVSLAQVLTLAKGGTHESPNGTGWIGLKKGQGTIKSPKCTGLDGVGTSHRPGLLAQVTNRLGLALGMIRLIQPQ